jgi:hypothetical protein
VRFPILACVLFILLAFQLAVGSESGVGSTEETPESAHAMSSSSMAFDNDACPMHHGLESPASTHSAHKHVGRNLGLDHQAGDQRAEKSADKHDCCKSSGCRCGNPALLVEFPANSRGAVPRFVQLSSVACCASSRADMHFRPPILRIS